MVSHFHAMTELILIVTLLQLQVIIITIIIKVSIKYL